MTVIKTKVSQTPMVLSTKRISTTAALDNDSTIRSIVRLIALNYFDYHRPEEYTDEDVNKILKRILELVKELKPSLKILGIPVAVTTAFASQTKMYLDDRIDWDDARDVKRYENAIEEFYLYLYEILVEVRNPKELSDKQRELYNAIDDTERLMVHCMLGYLADMGPKYKRAKMIVNTLKANANIFREDEDIMGVYRDAISEDGYTKPVDYQRNLDELAALIKRNKLKTVEGDEYTAINASLILLKEKNNPEYKRYNQLRKFLIVQAHRAIVGDLVWGCMGEPQRWDVVYRRITRGDAGVYVPIDQFPNEQWKGVVEATNLDGDYSIVHRSPFNEPLDKPVIGNVVMNPAYEKGSSVFVATFVVPTSGGTKQYAYTSSTTKSNNAERFKQTREIIDNLDAYRQRWLTHLSQFATALEAFENALEANAKSTTKVKREVKPLTAGLWRKGMLAAICELGFQVAPRTGEKGNSTLVNGKRVSTYALTTLQLRHITTTPTNLNPLYANESKGEEIGKLSKLILSYPGKANESQSHTITARVSSGDNATARRNLIKILDSYMRISSMSIQQSAKKLSKAELQNQAFFKLPNMRNNNTGTAIQNADGWAEILNRHVNHYLKTDIGFPSTFKMFRKLKGTMVFMREMDKVKDKLTKANIEQYMISAGITAGDELGHAAAKRKAGCDMAMKYYIDSSAILSYFALIGATPTKKVESWVRGNIVEDKADS